MDYENSKYTMKIGKTTYVVCVKQAENAKKPLESAFRDICRHEVLGDFSAANSFSFDKISKMS
ncbi:MAG: transposon-encoded TnpW family protein [Clostridiales bacterium]|nr:transposon-encoded TnpW family protein [Clostridiales bacterium]